VPKLRATPDRHGLFLGPDARATLWLQITKAIEAYFEGAATLPVATSAEQDALADLLMRGQVQMGRTLRARLLDGGWTVLNDTPLPVVCFSDRAHAGPSDAARLGAIAAAMVASG
jgi:hypothetical protein